MNTHAKSATSSPTGKIVVLSIFGVALAAAAFALYWNMSQTRRALEFWGPEAMRRIQKSERVEILPLQLLPADARQRDFENFVIAGQNWAATQPIDVTRARGLIHARHALTTDASYELGEPRELRKGPWSYAIRFSDSLGSTVLLLDGQRVGNLQGNQELELIPKVAEGWRSFVERETKAK